MNFLSLELEVCIYLHIELDVCIYTGSLHKSIKILFSRDNPINQLKDVFDVNSSNGAKDLS